MNEAIKLRLQPTIRWRRLEADAWACVQRCAAAPSSGGLDLPIPIDRWIENPLGINLEITDLSQLGPSILGAAYIAENTMVVDERVLANEGRFRFTCAHELAHMRLHQDVRDPMTDDFKPGGLEIAWYERQADRFAASLLMPAELLCNELTRLAMADGGNPAAVLGELLAGTAKSTAMWAGRFVPEMTKVFGVSREALIVRLCSLRLPNKRPMLSRSTADVLRRTTPRTNRVTPSSEQSAWLW